jgi:uncharacterized membrane protein
MEDFIAHIALPSLLCGLAFIVMGMPMYYYPPKEINSLFGYRTNASMKSQERRDFAQRFCAILAMKVSIIMIIVSLLAYLVPVDSDIRQLSGVFLVIISTAYLFYSTESAITNDLNKYTCL